MKAYISYKKWWIKCEAPSKIPSSYWGDTPEQAFRQHVTDMGLYRLMEILAAWPEEVTEPTLPHIKYPTKDNPFPYPQPLPTPFPRPMPTTPPTQPVWPGVRNCSKCGINLDGVMGYVCSDQACPTFMKVTC